MATFTVTTKLDVVNPNDGKLSLREAVAQANATSAADTILFGNAIQGRTLVLTGGELVVSRDLTIDGAVHVNGGETDRLFRTSNTNTDLSLVNLALEDGFVDGNGGAILVGGGNLTLENCLIQNCAVQGSSSYFNQYQSGGAIYAESGSRVHISGSRIIDCYAGGDFGPYASGGAIAGVASSVFIRDTALIGNHIGGEYYSEGSGGAIELRQQSFLQLQYVILDGSATSGLGNGGAISLRDSSGIIDRTSVINSHGDRGGGIFVNGGDLTLSNSTVANNRIDTRTGDGAGLYLRDGNLVVRNSTITGNENRSNYSRYTGAGGGIFVANATADIANTIVSGNTAYDPNDFHIIASDVVGRLTLSNGHNIFGSDVVGDVAGDREGVGATAIFAAIDPDTGGGLINPAGVAPLRADAANPAMGGADRLLFESTDQLGHTRPVPAGTNADAGALESGFAPSTAPSVNNDTLTGTAAADWLNGQAGHDFLKGLAGNDILNGGDGGDFLVGGAGNDKLNGGSGIDLVGFADSGRAVTVDLRGDAASDEDTAKRGGETDTLTGIEGAIGGSGNDRFFGDGGDNWFQGGKGKDIFTGGAGRDLYDYNLTSASPAGSGRDVITDFAHLADKFDLAGIDADATVAGNQIFHWVGGAALTGPGEVGYFTSGGNTIIHMSTDADVAAEAEIQLTGIRTLSEQDFYL